MTSSGTIGAGEGPYRKFSLAFACLMVVPITSNAGSVLSTPVPPKTVLSTSIAYRGEKILTLVDHCPSVLPKELDEASTYQSACESS